MPAFDLVQGRCKGAKTWDPVPRPTIKFPHILVDNAVLFELRREAHYTLPDRGQGSVDDQAQGWWLCAFHIERFSGSQKYVPTFEPNLHQELQLWLCRDVVGHTQGLQSWDTHLARAPTLG